MRTKSRPFPEKTRVSRGPSLRGENRKSGGLGESTQEGVTGVFGPVVGDR